MRLRRKRRVSPRTQDGWLRYGRPSWSFRSMRGWCYRLSRSTRYSALEGTHSLGRLQLAQVNRTGLQTKAHLLTPFSLHAFYYRQLPVGVPPSMTIPGDKAQDTDEPLTDPSSPFVASTTTSLCKFWRILNPIIKLFVPEEHQSPLSQRLTLAIAEDTFQKLLSWADENLLKGTKDGNLDQPHHVLVMQYVSTLRTRLKITQLTLIQHLVSYGSDGDLSTVLRPKSQPQHV